MTNHVGYIHESKLQPFCPPSFCRTSGAALEEHAYYYKKGYRQVIDRLYNTPEQKPQQIAA